MNVAEVVTRVRRTFGDESGVQVADADVIRWINDAQEQIILDNDGLMEATGTASTVANQKEYNLPTDLSVLRSLAYKGFHLKSMSFNEFNQYVDGYQAPVADNPHPTGVPTVYMMWNGIVWLYPVPSESVTNSLTIYYIKHPPVITTNADELGLPKQYHNSIVQYVMAQAYELDENLDAKQMKEAEFTTSTTKLNDRNKWTSQETYPSITILPEDQSFGDYHGY